MLKGEEPPSDLLLVTCYLLLGAKLASYQSYGPKRQPACEKRLAAVRRCSRFNGIVLGQDAITG